jgi:nitrilase
VTSDVVRVAAVQAAPVFLDRDATIERVATLTEKAAGDGAQLVVFPETFVPTYPDWVWRTRPWDHNATALFTRLADQAVVVGGAACDALGAIASRSGVHLSVGVNEREENGSTLYNTQLLFAPDGQLLSRHRKLMPTGGERLVWGCGDGSTLDVVPTAIGRIGGLTCWENLMPLARAAVYAQGVEIYLAPTWDNGDAWVSTLRHIAREGRCFVVGVNFCIRGADVPAGIPGRDELYGGDDDWLSKGNSAIVDPNGTLLAGPLVGEEGIVAADLDLTAVRTAGLQFDAVGHYSRPDVLRLVVDRGAKAPVIFGSSLDDGGGERQIVSRDD